jgi:ribosomal protein S27E
VGCVGGSSEGCGRQGGRNEGDSEQGGHRQESSRGLIGFRLGTFLSGKCQECGDTKRLYSAGQTTLQGHLETSVCSILMYPCFFSPHSKVLFYVHFFSHNSSSSSTSPVPRKSGMAIVVISVAPTVGTATLVTAAEVALELAADDTPQTPEGVPEDVFEESEEEPEMLSELAPEVVLEEVPVEGAMIVAHVADPLPHGAVEASPPAPPHSYSHRRCCRCCGEPEVVMGHPTSHALDDIPVDEAVSMAHKALS